MRIRTNVVYFRVMRRVYRREWNWLCVNQHPWQRTRGHGVWRLTSIIAHCLNWASTVLNNVFNLYLILTCLCSQGSTGYPWIDACMKQLQQEGWIHQVCRHATACFLYVSQYFSSMTSLLLFPGQHRLSMDRCLHETATARRLDPPGVPARHRMLLDSRRPVDQLGRWIKGMICRKHQHSKVEGGGRGGGGRRRRRRRRRKKRRRRRRRRRKKRRRRRRKRRRRKRKRRRKEGGEEKKKKEEKKMRKKEKAWYKVDLLVVRYLNFSITFTELPSNTF